MKHLPTFILGQTVFINQVGRLGTAKQITLPKLERMRETILQGGFERSMDTGVIKAMEAEYTFSEYSDSVYRAASGDEQAEYVSKGSIKQGKKQSAVVATIRGDFDIDDGNWETGKEVERKVKQYVDFYSLEIDGVEQCLFDLENIICRIHGVDYFEKLRNHIL